MLSVELLVMSGLVLGCAAVAAAGASLARHYALARSIMDLPGARRSHVIPTPRGGGVGIVLAVSGAMLVAVQFAGAPVDRQLLVALTGFLAVAGVGWWDDHRPLPAWSRLVVHLVAALAVSLAVLGTPASVLEFLALAAAVLLVAGMTNAWNFMDGINGIASAQAVVVALALVWLPGALPWPWVLVCLGVAAACLGFLPFNFPRARIFLGDVGSGALGFVLGVLIVCAAARSTPGHWPWLALVPTLFILDSGATLLWRVLRGRRWWQPHREHVYQWAVRKGHTHARITTGYTVIAVVIAAIAVMGWPHPGALAWAVWVVVWLALLMTGIRLKSGWAGRRRGRRSS